jgi:Phospholipase_D-nuclease N-terminal
MFGQSWETIGLGFLIAAILGFWAVFNIVQNEKTGPLGKAIWSVCVLWIPYLGFFAWLLFGPRATKKAVL